MGPAPYVTTAPPTTGRRPPGKTASTTGIGGAAASRARPSGGVRGVATGRPLAHEAAPKSPEDASTSATSDLLRRTGCVGSDININRASVARRLGATTATGLRYGGVHVPRPRPISDALQFALAYASASAPASWALRTALHAALALGAMGCTVEADEVPLYPVPFKADEGRLQIYDGTRFNPVFIKGMNLGVGLPGTQAGELAPTAEDYDRWFSMLGEMGINTVRLYTLHYPRFYQRLQFYNMRHRQRPLYVLHGIWLDEDDPSNNLRDMQSHFDDNIVESIDCVHGRNFVFERLGRAHGEFDADISPWVIGWLVGREVFPDEVQTTNRLPTARSRYDGRYVSLPSGSETEVWWAERIDQIAAYEAEKYGVARPISVSSWPTLDPIHHPTEGRAASEDREQLDLAQLDTRGFPAGYFASYHAYPYYPDWMSEEPSYLTAVDREGPNSYFGYLKVLRAHYFPKPVVVAEVGVPCSWGNAHFAHSGMNHGGQDELQQGHDDARLFRDNYDAGTGGAILFAWIDEWWKRTWIVDELAFPRERYKLWHNVTSPEQNFGLLGFEPDPPAFDMFSPTTGGGRIAEVRASVDAEFFHLKLRLTAPLADGEPLVIGYDTYDDARGESVLPNGKRTAQRSELALTVTLPGEAELRVMEAYDQFGVWHDIQDAWHDKEVSELPGPQPYHSIASDGGKWNLVRWKNNTTHGSEDGVYKFPETVQEIGRLRVRRSAEPETGHSAVIVDGSELRIRVPWTLLQITDPSSLLVLDDDPKTRPRETTVTEGIRVAVSLGDELVETPRHRWARWDKTPPYRERRKLGYAIFAEALRTIPDR